MSDSSLSISNNATPAQGATPGASVSSTERASIEAPSPQGPASEGPDLRAQGVLFRRLLESPQTARQWADFAAPGFQRAPAAPAAALAGSPDPAIAELIERHIRRALASVDSDSADGEIRIELSDAVFPGTALTLKRTADGWQLTATADNRQSLDELNQFTPALVDRFEKASLGHLRVTLDRG